MKAQETIISENNETASKLVAPDLTKRPPRSLRVELGGFAILPRLLDKCRATLASTNGEYHFNCPLDQLFLQFVGLNPEALQEQVATGKNDGEMLEWVQKNSSIKRGVWEIDAWTEYQGRRSPHPNTDLFEYYVSTLKEIGPSRTDTQSWAELLDLDDYCSFGGAA
ncbi:DUF5069 domain-containing protein [Puniceicoccaceae bacterium K14]|nr:DUF5069 domain-containing protein [Puniceicoccaceae bacterium K14]